MPEIEVEIRTVVDSDDEKQKIIDNLLNRGFHLKKQLMQYDVMFDKKDASLFRGGEKVRYRVERDLIGSTVTIELTGKGDLRESEDVSRRWEGNLEIVGNPLNALDVLTRIFSMFDGVPLFQIEKCREPYEKDGIKVTFDEWPIVGCIIEFEGDEEQLIALAKEVAPEHSFGNRRLKDFFEDKMKATGKTLQELKADYLELTGFDLGKIELIL